MPIPYKDLGDQPEDERIAQIGNKAMQDRMVVGFIVDADSTFPGKAERYIEKLRRRFPGIRIISVSPGPVADTTLVKVGPPLI